MTPRRPCRRRRNDVILLAVQRMRLEQIARREVAPEGLREACFLAMLKDGGQLPLRDFMVSPILFLIEMRDRDLAASSAA